MSNVVAGYDPKVVEAMINVQAGRFMANAAEYQCWLKTQNIKHIEFQVMQPLTDIHGVVSGQVPTRHPFLDILYTVAMAWCEQRGWNFEIVCELGRIPFAVLTRTPPVDDAEYKRKERERLGY